MMKGLKCVIQHLWNVFVVAAAVLNKSFTKAPLATLTETPLVSGQRGSKLKVVGSLEAMTVNTEEQIPNPKGVGTLVFTQKMQMHCGLKTLYGRCLKRVSA